MVYLPKNNMKLVILGYPLFSDKPISDTQLLGNRGSVGIRTKYFTQI